MVRPFCFARSNHHGTVRSGGFPFEMPTVWFIQCPAVPQNNTKYVAARALSGSVALQGLPRALLEVLLAIVVQARASETVTARPS